ncbi:hypothetical protein [Leptolyngbya sp. BC1307]|uniref:hypothetical protein n=1 Tax=Leptolyngbya sp. BC1307 TaxID=2029589 RepID=UPI000EFA341E|nr:hypothetical protein [Leptolyngbya sp. BC1307]
MSDEEGSQIPVTQLFTRYGLSKSAVYKRMADLGIKRQKLGNRAYIAADQVALLDELHEHIKQGGNTAEFLVNRKLNLANPATTGAADQSVELSSGLVLSQTDLWKLARAIIAEIVAIFRKGS